MTEIDHDTYMLMCVLLTGVVAAYWIVVDSVRLARALGRDRDQPVVRDQIFGSVIGILVGIVGVFGSLNYYYW